MTASGGDAAPLLLLLLRAAGTEAGSCCCCSSAAAAVGDPVPAELPLPWWWWWPLPLAVAAVATVAAKGAAAAAAEGLAAPPIRSNRASGMVVVGVVVWCLALHSWLCLGLLFCVCVCAQGGDRGPSCRAASIGRDSKAVVCGSFFFRSPKTDARGVGAGERGKARGARARACEKGFCACMPRGEAQAAKRPTRRGRSLRARKQKRSVCVCACAFLFSSLFAFTRWQGVVELRRARAAWEAKAGAGGGRLTAAAADQTLSPFVGALFLSLSLSKGGGWWGGSRSLCVSLVLSREMKDQRGCCSLDKGWGKGGGGGGLCLSAPPVRGGVLRLG